ncbi:MAG: pyridoxamine kinase [Thermoguttaceae bacterium]|jgi:pyridoxine kinase
MKRILTIQDVSGVGKCSLTVALPIISAAQIETCVLPTAVLSTHTQFKHYTFADLTDQIAPIAETWVKEGIAFDAIYTGYLGSYQQMELIEDLIEKFRTPENFVFVDPVLGDAGELYARFDQAFADRMALFAAKADVVTPNLTEASAMLRVPYVESGYDEAYVHETLRKLCALGPNVAVVKGIDYGYGDLGVVGYDKRSDQFFSYFHERIPGQYHGTGDIFASAAVAAITQNRPYPEAFQIAADFTVDSIRRTIANPDARTYGVDFESALPDFVAKFAQNRS